MATKGFLGTLPSGRSAVVLMLAGEPDSALHSEDVVQPDRFPASARGRHGTSGGRGPQGLTSLLGQLHCTLSDRTVPVVGLADHAVLGSGLRRIALK